MSPEQRDDNTLLMRRHSLSSIDSDHRALIEIQSPTYVHQYDASCGIQFDGSRSLFTRFERDDTARSVLASEVSLAKAVRRASLHAHAPESHASFSATTWSMSTAVRSDVVTPSYGERQSASTTKQRKPSTCANPIASRRRTCSRASQPSPSVSSQCGNASRRYPAGRSRSTGIVASTSVAGRATGRRDVPASSVAATRLPPPATTVMLKSAPAAATRHVTARWLPRG